jgi:hypothetical protein
MVALLSTFVEGSLYDGKIRFSFFAEDIPFATFCTSIRQFEVALRSLGRVINVSKNDA